MNRADEAGAGMRDGAAVGAYEAPPLRCSTLRRIVEASNGEWRDEEAADLAYGLPAQATAEVLDYLRPLARAVAPPRGWARLPAARVFGAGVVLSADGTALARDVSEDFGKAPDAHWLLGHGRMRPPVALSGVTAVAAVNRGAGYCHWLLEELPRLLALPVGGEADNIVAHAAGGFARQAWAARGGRVTLVVARRASYFSCAPLIVPGLVAEAGRPTPEAVRRVREFAERLGRDADARAVADAVGERVYVSRAKAARRRVGEEDALWRELEGRGFARVFFEDLSWAAQIAVARRARVIVGAHGAGLANTLFCAPGTRVVELVNRAYFNPVFWRLAALGGLDYRPLVTASVGDGPICEDRARNREDVAVDLAAVRAALAG